MWRKLKDSFQSSNNVPADVEREPLLDDSHADYDEDSLDDLDSGPDSDDNEGKDPPLPVFEKNNMPQNTNVSQSSNALPVEMEQLLPKDKPTTSDDKSKTYAFWNSMIIVLLCLFIAEASRGLVAPSLWLYIKHLGGDKRFLGYVVGTYSAGRLIGSILLGWWYNKRGAKEVLIVSLVCSIIGNVMYSLSSVTNLWMIFISRTLVGFGTGILSVVRAFVAESTTKEQRLRFIAYSAAVQFIGFAVVPGGGALLTMIDFHIGSVPIDKFTSAGYVLAIVNLLIALLVLFRLPKTKPKPEEESASTTKEVLPDQSNKRLVYIGVGLFIFLNFVARGVLALLETVGPPVFLEAWNDDSTDAVGTTSTMMLILGLIGLVIFFLIDYVQKILREPILLVFGFVITTLGCLLLINYNEPERITLVQFLVGAGLVWSIGAPVTQTLVISTFSKILGTKPQGTWMGWIGSAASVGRIITPTLSGFGINESLIISAIASFICSIAVVIYYYLVKLDRRRRALIDLAWKNKETPQQRQVPAA